MLQEKERLFSKRVAIVLLQVSIPLTLFKFYQMFGNKMKPCDALTPAWRREFIPLQLILYSSVEALSSNWDELRTQWQSGGSRPFQQRASQVLSQIKLLTVFIA